MKVEICLGDVAVPKRHDGVTGIAIKRPDARLLADAILALAARPERARAMGEAARELAFTNFTPATNARKLFDLYQRVVASSVTRQKAVRMYTPKDSGS